jgi:hypothetical protein
MIGGFRISLLPSLKKLLDDRSMDDSENARADWMWQLRPKSAFGGFLDYCLVFAGGISLPLIHEIGLLLDVVWLFAGSLLIASDKVRAIRWRRDYEATLCRLTGSVRRRKTI